MSANLDYRAELLKRVETLLDQTPEGQDDALRDMQAELRSLRKESRTDALEQVVQLLGTAVGKQKGWQTPFREAGILALALEDLDTGVEAASLSRQFLRVIGNCVADNDLNREVVTKDLKTLMMFITDQNLTTIVLIVLFNLCNDYDPAQAVAATLRLDTLIASELFFTRIPSEALDYAVDLLTWTTGKLTAEQLKDEFSLKTFKDLLKTALEYDEDHYHEYVAILVHYLQDAEFQQRVCTPEILDDLVILMLDFEARLTPPEIEAVFNELAITKAADTPSSDSTTVLLHSQLINSISSISATDAFASTITIHTPAIERIRAKLAYPTASSPSAVCACVILGNLAMSDAVCIDMVTTMQLHLPLCDILFFSTHSALLYAALGFLRHLAFPEPNRAELGNARVIEACHRYLVLYPDDAAVRGEMAALVCKLVTNSPKNIERVVMHRVGERRGEEGELPLRSVTDGPSCLGDVVKQALEPARPLPSTAMKNFVVEAGRTVVAILRYLGRAEGGGDLDVDAVRQRMFEVPYVARPVARLVRQRFYADARAEGLLGLGLMAQSPYGAARVVEEIKEDGGLVEAIKEFAEGKDGGVEQQGQTAGRDYQNAMVLLQALQNNGSEMDEALRDRVISLQDELGKIMI